jgi:c-di-AMP phosphodiesterase-like protein
VAVIDHHRRAATYIDNATVNFNEPYASSACELVTELLQYIVDQRTILRVEADALLTGIVLDTKTFAIHTGSRTFDAAAFLRRLGADTVDVKMLMQSDFSTAMARYEIIRGANIYRDGVAVASSASAASRVIIAQSADELLNIAGVSASFVLAPNDGGIFISGRSIGHVNVQLILEKLGGGGNQSIAGGRMDGVGADGALAALHAAIDGYLAEHPQ